MREIKIKVVLQLEDGINVAEFLDCMQEYLENGAEDAKNSNGDVLYEITSLETVS